MDELAAETVQNIFHWKISGMNNQSIADRLNAKKVPSPAARKLQSGAKLSLHFRKSDEPPWSAKAVDRILHNEVYLQRSHWTSGTVYHVLKNEKYKGTYVGAKFIMPVPCKHRVLRAPLEQQVRIEDSHAAIVTPEEFEQAQKVIMCWQAMLNEP